MSAMHSVAKVTGKAVATAFDLSRFKTACDLGGKETPFLVQTCFYELKLFFFDVLLFFCAGCTGALAHEFTKAHPELCVTVFDLPAVVEMSKHFCPPQSENRVSFVAGKFV